MISFGIDFRGRQEARPPDRRRGKLPWSHVSSSREPFNLLWVPTDAPSQSGRSMAGGSVTASPGRMHPSSPIMAKPAEKRRAHSAAVRAAKSPRLQARRRAVGGPGKPSALLPPATFGELHPMLARGRFQQQKGSRASPVDIGGSRRGAEPRHGASSRRAASIGGGRLARKGANPREGAGATVGTSLSARPALVDAGGEASPSRRAFRAAQAGADRASRNTRLRCSVTSRSSAAFHLHRRVLAQEQRAGGADVVQVQRNAVGAAAGTGGEPVMHHGIRQILHPQPLRRKPQAQGRCRRDKTGKPVSNRRFGSERCGETPCSCRGVSGPRRGRASAPSCSHLSWPRLSTAIRPHCSEMPLRPRTGPGDRSPPPACRTRKQRFGPIRLRHRVIIEEAYHLARRRHDPRRCARPRCSSRACGSSGQPSAKGRVRATVQYLHRHLRPRSPRIASTRIWPNRGEATGQWRGVARR